MQPAGRARHNSLHLAPATDVGTKKAGMVVWWTGAAKCDFTVPNFMRQQSANGKGRWWNCFLYSGGLRQEKQYCLYPAGPLPNRDVIDFSTRLTAGWQILGRRRAGRHLMANQWWMVWKRASNAPAPPPNCWRVHVYGQRETMAIKKRRLSSCWNGNGLSLNDSYPSECQRKLLLSTETFLFRR